MVDTIVDNTTAIEDLKDKQLKMKPKVYTFKNHYYFPSVGEEFVSNIVTDDQGEEHETGGPLYLDLSTNKLYK